MGNFSFGKKKLFKKGNSGQFNKSSWCNAVSGIIGQLISGTRPKPDTESVRNIRIKIIVNSLGVIQTFKDKRNCL